MADVLYRIGRLEANMGREADARATYSKALDVLSDMKSRGMAIPPDAVEEQRVMEMIAGK